MRWNVSLRARRSQLMSRNRFCKTRSRPTMPTSMQVSRQRAERRISVRLPMQVTGRDSRGVLFEEETSSENLCRSGAAFLTRFDLAVGSQLEIRIPLSNAARRTGPRRLGVAGSNGRWAFAGGGDRFALPRSDSDFATQGRVV